STPLSDDESSSPPVASTMTTAMIAPTRRVPTKIRRSRFGVFGFGAASSVIAGAAAYRPTGSGFVEQDRDPVAVCVGHRDVRPVRAVEVDDPAADREVVDRVVVGGGEGAGTIAEQDRHVVVAGVGGRAVRAAVPVEVA